jgi:HPt (histidine-containing phosphotransfer) domain-containing protein
MNFKELAAELGLEEDEYRELVELFMTTGAAEFEKLKAAWTAGDVDTVMRSAHTIKGASGNLGLTDVYNTATTIEKSADNGQLDGLEQHLSTLQTQIDAIATFVGK